MAAAAPTSFYCNKVDLVRTLGERTRECVNEWEERDGGRLRERKICKN